MVKTLTYGMIGGGSDVFIGGTHRRAIGLGGITVIVAGVFLRNREKSLQATGELGTSTDRCYEDYRVMARTKGEREDGTDFVVVVIPNQSHYETRRTFLEAGIHAACGKSVTTTYRRAKELETLAEEEGLLFMVTYTYMDRMTAKYAGELVAFDAIREMRTVMAEYPQGWLAFEDDFGGKQGEWRCDPQQSSGVNCLGDLGTYAENAVVAMTGFKIKCLLTKMGIIIPGRMLDDNDSILMEYDSGAAGIYWTSQVAVRHDNNLQARIYGSGGIIQQFQETFEEITIIDADGTIREIYRGYGAIEEKANKYGRLPTEHPEGWIKAMGNLYRGFVECIRAKQEGTFDLGMADYPTMSQGVERLTFVEACSGSNKNGNMWVELERG